MVIFHSFFNFYQRVNVDYHNWLVVWKMFYCSIYLKDYYINGSMIYLIHYTIH